MTVPMAACVSGDVPTAKTAPASHLSWPLAVTGRRGSESPWALQGVGRSCGGSGDERGWPAQRVGV